MALVVAVPAGIHLGARGSKDEAVVRKDDGGWAAREDLLALERPVEPAPDIPSIPRAPVADTTVVSDVIAAPPPVELSPPPPERTAAPVAAPVADKLFSKKRQTRREAEADKPVKTDGENRYFTLELSGSIGGAELDAEDSQTWARLSYFVRQEARRPHFLVYPDGSMPLSVAPAVNGKPVARRPAGEEVEPGGDPNEPAYRLVIHASASQGQGVTFLRQRLASSYGCQVKCRIDRRVGDSWKALASASAVEGINPQTAEAAPDVYLRRVYDAAIEKLLLQLASQPPFGAAAGK